MKSKDKGLSAWQLTLLALGTVIGGSFFLGSSVAISAAGPSVLIAYGFGGILVYFILSALSEMTVASPDAGSFRAFAANAFGEGAGFVVGWVYWTGMVLAMSSEATAISILVRVWAPTASIPLLGSTVIVFVTLINLLGADKLSRLESGLAGIKIFAILAFIVTALLLIFGLIPGKPAVGVQILTSEPFFRGGMKSILGSMLIVLFAYAGFEVIGLAAAEAKNLKKTVPRAIRATVVSLVSLYLLSSLVLLPLIPTTLINENSSPMVLALSRHGISFAGTAINLVLITAILSTMLAAMFGIGRMMRSLADERLAPGWLKDHTEVPYRGILFSGAAMLAGLLSGILVPRIYLFLISSGGFAILFTYAVIMASHIRFRKNHGCPDGKCQLPFFPYTSVLVLLILIASAVSMPFISGQTAGLVAGIGIVLFYTLCYNAIRLYKKSTSGKKKRWYQGSPVPKLNLSAEIAEELTEEEKK